VHLRPNGQALAAVALLDPLAPDAADRLEAMWERDRVQGFRRYPIRDKDGSWLHAPSQDAIWARAGRLGIPLIAFIGMPPARGSGAPRGLPGGAAGSGRLDAG
jgi:hypothetical protein